MDNYRKNKVFNTTDGLCNKKFSMDLAVDMQTNPDQGESVNLLIYTFLKFNLAQDMVSCQCEKKTPHRPYADGGTTKGRFSRK